MENSYAIKKLPSAFSQVFLKKLKSSTIYNLKKNTAFAFLRFREKSEHKTAKSVRSVHRACTSNRKPVVGMSAAGNAATNLTQTVTVLVYLP